MMDSVFQLSTEQADKLSFPEGCPVFYNFRRNHHDNINDEGAVITEVREGIVKAVYMNPLEKRFEYKIERRVVTSTASMVEVAMVMEDDISYAIGCPVLVAKKMKKSGKNTTAGEEQPIKGKVLFAKPIHDITGRISMSYIVQYEVEGGWRIEEGVVADRLKFDKSAMVAAVEVEQAVAEQSVKKREDGSDAVITSGGSGNDDSEDIAITSIKEKKREEGSTTIIPEKESIAVKSSSGIFEDVFEDGNLVLLGEGVFQRNEKDIYSVALYSDMLAKASISSLPSSDGTQAINETLHAALKCAKRTTFLIVLNVELGIQEMIGEIWDIVTPHVSNNAALANISSLMYASGKDAFPEGTKIMLDCMSGGEVIFTVDGEEVGSVRGESDAFLEVFLGNASEFPSLHLSVVENCCKSGELSDVGGSSSNLARVVVVDKNDKVPSSSSDDTLNSFQETVRYLTRTNKEIEEKAALCQTLAAGLLHEGISPVSTTMGV